MEKNWKGLSNDITKNILTLILLDNYFTQEGFRTPKSYNLSIERKAMRQI